MHDPLLIHVPERIDTERLIIRCAQPGDGALLNAAVCDSLDALRPYVPWAGAVPTLADSEAVCRKGQARFRLREHALTDPNSSQLNNTRPGTPSSTSARTKSLWE